MKIIYFRKERDSQITYYQNYLEDCFYLPQSKIVLTKVQPVMGAEGYLLNNEPETIKEAQLIEEGKAPELSGITFSDRKIFDYCSHGLDKLDNLIKNYKELINSSNSKNTKEVKDCIEDLLQHINME